MFHLHIMAAHLQSAGPYDHLLMDFIKVTAYQGNQYCLPIIDMFSKWVECFPSRHAEALSVAQNLVILWKLFQDEASQGNFLVTMALIAFQKVSR